MQLVKLITPKRIKTLHCLFLAFLVLFLSSVQTAFSQDNSPYSRYGIGDLVPHSSIMSRGMGGISAAYTDPYSINFANPASYASFQTILEAKSKKLVMGRAILDIGVNFENRTLREPATTKPKFTASNALFSYIQVGMPIKNNWGLSFGLRPVSRISYNIIWNGKINDAGTGSPIDSGSISNTGKGGAYLASVGTGFSILRKTKIVNNQEIETEKLAIGINGGYYFGSKDYSTRIRLLNDTVDYKVGNYETRTNFGSLYFNAGLQYKVMYDNNRKMFTFGASGNWGQKISATQDRIIETYIFDESIGNLRLDSVSDTRNVKGKINIPASYTVGFLLQKFTVQNKEGGWMFGIDFTQQNWSRYRYYGQTDSVRNSWQIRLGAQINPIPKVRNYFSNVAYRFGLFMGPDYIQVQKKLPQLGGSFGLGLPVRPNAQAPNQVTLINLAFEYGKRGNNDNLLKETMFRFSLGFSLSDMWFIKRKYD
jgi:hypothetical protein